MLMDTATGETVPLHYLQTEGVDKRFLKDFDPRAREEADRDAERRPLNTRTAIQPEQLNEIFEERRRSEIQPIVQKTI